VSEPGFWEDLYGHGGDGWELGAPAPTLVEFVESTPPPLGPTVGTALTIALAECLRVIFGVKLIGMAETIYGLRLVLFIIFLPAGIYGSAHELLTRRRRQAPARAAA
jgi:hypothetical protein